jgi:hypothetical protein
LSSSGKQAFGVHSSPHRCLGHPSSVIVHHILRDMCIQFSESKKGSVCDAFKKAKSHELSYPKSSSVPFVPLELVFSDVLGPDPNSVGHNNYYFRYIGDYSKLTLIYLLRNKSDVFQKFHDFQHHVERLFDKKIDPCSTN